MLNETRATQQTHCVSSGARLLNAFAFQSSGLELLPREVRLATGALEISGAARLASSTLMRLGRVPMGPFMSRSAPLHVVGDAHPEIIIALV